MFSLSMPTINGRLPSNPLSRYLPEPWTSLPDLWWPMRPPVEAHAPQRGAPFTIPRPAAAPTTAAAPLRMSKPSRISAPKVTAESSLGEHTPLPKNTVFLPPVAPPPHTIVLPTIIAPALHLAPPMTFPTGYAYTNTAPAPFHSAPAPMFSGPSPFFVNPAAFQPVPLPISDAATRFHIAPVHSIPQHPYIAGPSTTSQVDFNTQAAEGDRQRSLKRSRSGAHYDDCDDYHYLPPAQKASHRRSAGGRSEGTGTPSRSRWGYIPEAATHPETFASRVEGMETLPSTAEHSGIAPSGTVLHQQAQEHGQPGAPAHTHTNSPPSTTKGVKTAYCTDCNKWFRGPKELERHQTSTKAHGATRDFECPTCGTDFLRKDTMNHHQLIHARGQAIAEEGWEEEEDWEEECA
ncbi:hypothetical protein EW146_g10045 [Bondarzewia mesenterica]|uniref:C2H2-type domain-containing protein n=1 Tax=Bondarzewia mesenterica TaxID=1095465 RepID=A0A4S4L5Q3_9AGAM|nr:hypothetical protein EW146_g10045 [Bondarzewia mesenterica]